MNTLFPRTIVHLLWSNFFRSIDTSSFPNFHPRLQVIGWPLTNDLLPSAFHRRQDMAMIEHINGKSLYFTSKIYKFFLSTRLATIWPSFLRVKAEISLIGVFFSCFGLFFIIEFFSHIFCWSMLFCKSWELINPLAY